MSAEKMAPTDWERSKGARHVMGMLMVIVSRDWQESRMESTVEQQALACLPLIPKGSEAGAVLSQANPRRDMSRTNGERSLALSSVFLKIGRAHV